MSGLSVSLEPKPDESIIGYLARVGERYDGLSPLQVTKQCGLRVGTIDALATQDIPYGRLARGLQVQPSKLNRMSYRPLAGGNTVQFLGGSIRREYVTTHHRRACPKCLQEAGYHRAIWDLSFLTICPKHSVKLIAECPNCKKEGRRCALGWTYGSVRHCKCGCDLAGVVTKSVGSDALLGLRFVLDHLMRTLGNQTRSFPKLPSEHLPYVLLEIGWRYETSEGRPRPIQLLRRGYDFASCLNRGYRALSDWPRSFHDYIDYLSYQAKSTTARFGLAKIRSRLSWLLDSRDPALVDLISEAERHLTKGLVGWTRRLRLRPLLSAACITLKQAARMLRHSVGRIRAALLLMGAAVEQDGKGKGAPVLIERKAVEVLRAKVQATLNMTAARRAIGTSKPVARAILRSGLIQPATGPAAILVGRDCWDAVEITNFLTRLEARIKPLCGAKNFCFSHALGLARNVGVGPVELLNLISMRGVRGAYQGNARSLNSLRLSSEDVERVLGLAADISVPALAARLRIKQQVAYHLCATGFFQPTRSRLKRGLRVGVDQVERFRDKYAFPSQVGIDKGRYPGWLSDKLIEAGYKPVSGPSVDDGRQYLFRRKSVESFISTL